MKIHIELDEKDLKELIQEKIEKETDRDIELKDISILVKSSQNYKAEWENALIKAEYNYNK